MNLPLTQLLPKEIELLDADALVKLLHRLLHCEARVRQLSTPGILVPFQINVPDGGRDGRWAAEIGQHEYIPRALTYYQCKAEHIKDAVCKEEMVSEKKEGKETTYSVKPRVSEVLRAGGCYAFFSSKHEIKPTEATELDKVARDQLKLAGFEPHAEAKIEFFGANRIADWANHFPSAVRFVRENTKDLGGIHFHTIESWERQVSAQGVYYSNTTLRDKIAAIRTELSEGKTRVVRLTGLSGLGKTRLALEALKSGPDDTVSVKALSAETIYLSYGDVSAELLNFINHLVSGGYSAVVVIDDCPPEIHDRVVMVTAKSQLSIVTIYHERQLQREDTSPITIEPDALTDIVQKILRESTILLAQGEEAIAAVASFAGGFPQIAKLLVEFRRAPSMRELADRAGLFQKLLSGGAPPDDPTLKTVQSLALFQFVGGSKRKLEADFEFIRLRFCPQVSSLDFKQVIENQKDRRIIQQTADTLTVAPRPLAVALTASFLPVCPGDWKEHLAAMKSADLMQDFIRRFEELELSEKVEELAQIFLEEKIPFADAEYLLSGATASQMFRALAVLNPSSATKIAKKVIGRATLERLAEAKDARRHLVRALEILSWNRTTFFDAAPLLLRLAAAENEQWANNATGEFTQLFHLALSGTTVPAKERLLVLREALNSEDPRIRRIAVKALGSALEDRGFTRTDDTTIGGTRNPNRDWRPSTQQEILEYWRASFLLLLDLIALDSPESSLAREVFAQNAGSILRSPLLLELEPDFKRLAGHVKGLWPELKAAIRNVIQYSKPLATDHRTALERWIDYLTPPAVAIDERLRDIVTKPGWQFESRPDGSHVDLAKLAAEQFAAELSKQSVDLRPYLASLLAGEQQQAIAFGISLARLHPLARTFIDVAISTWLASTAANRNDLLICGLIHGLTDRTAQTEILERLSQNPAAGMLLVSLTTALPEMTEVDFLRVRSAIEHEQKPGPSLLRLVRGLPLKTLPEAFLKRQLRELSQLRPDTVPDLFQVLFTHCYSDATRLASFSDIFREWVLAPDLPLSDQQVGWEWNEVTKFLISNSADEKWLLNFSRHVVGLLKSGKNSRGTSHLRNTAVALLRQSPQSAWPAFGEALLDEDQTIRFLVSDFLGSGEDRFDDHSENCPLWAVPMPLLRDWARKNPRAIPTLLDRLQLFTAEKDAAGVAKFLWHPHSLMLIENAPDEEEALDEIFSNLYSFGSMGSRVPYWERRLALAQDLTAAKHPRLQRLGHYLEAQIAEALEQTKRQELNEQARRNLGT